MEGIINHLIELFVNVDDFLQGFLGKWHKSLISSGDKKRLRSSKLSQSEIITIVILFHQSNYRTFKHFYLEQVQTHLKNYFPNLVSYGRFVILKKSILVSMCAYLQSRKGMCSGISYVDLRHLQYAIIEE